MGLREIRGNGQENGGVGGEELREEERVGHGGVADQNEVSCPYDTFCFYNVTPKKKFAFRSKIFAKCKDLKSKSKIKDVTTKNGDIIVLVDVKQKTSDSPCDDGDGGGNADEGEAYVERAVARVVERSSDSDSPISPSLTSERDSPSTITQKMIVVTDEDFSNLLKITKGLGDEDDIAELEKVQA